MKFKEIKNEITDEIGAITSELLYQAAIGAMSSQKTTLHLVGRLQDILIALESVEDEA